MWNYLKLWYNLLRYRH